MRMATNEEKLRRLALHDERLIESLLAMNVSDVENSGLDPRTHALVRLGALVVMGGDPVSFHWSVGSAMAGGATKDDIVGTLIAVAPIGGLTGVISATPEIALPIGYDIDAALEAFNDVRD
jgi:alkylhydroperoxidase/carboxymuconolactone decarboxylase family protein YurZ